MNELVVNGRGNAYVNGGGFDMMAGEEFAPGLNMFTGPRSGLVLTTEAPAPRAGWP